VFLRRNGRKLSLNDFNTAYRFIIHILELRRSKRFKSGLSMERPKNPNEQLIREIIQEDLPLFKMLATNGKYKPADREK
jgi:hypothetical protein